MRDGFQVDVGQRAFGRLYDRIKPGTVALIFFSGYGIQSNRQSYMIPVDGQIYKEDDVRHDGISVDNVLSEMNNRGAGVKIAIFDASRRNRFEGNFRAAPLGLTLPANPPSGTLAMYSAGSGGVVRDAANDRGLFVSELLKEMRAPGVPAEEVSSLSMPSFDTPKSSTWHRIACRPGVDCIADTPAVHAYLFQANGDIGPDTVASRTPRALA
jgi:hypothetical protein